MKTKMMCLMLLSALSVSAFGESKLAPSRMAKATIVVNKVQYKTDASGKQEKIIEQICKKTVSAPVYKTTKAKETFETDGLGLKCESTVEGKRVTVSTFVFAWEGRLPDIPEAVQLGIVGTYTKYFAGVMYVIPSFWMSKDPTSDNAATALNEAVELSKNLQGSIFSGGGVLEQSASKALLFLQPSGDICQDQDASCRYRERFEAYAVIDDKR